MARAHTREALGRFAMKGDCGPSSRLAGDFDIAPAHTVAPTGAQSFHACFFGSEACSITPPRTGLGVAIADLAFGEHAVQEAVAVAGQGLRDAGDLRNVDAG